jgi:hypothetical protein
MALGNGEKGDLRMVLYKRGINCGVSTLGRVLRALRLVLR